jgi:hypothetical protein
MPTYEVTVVIETETAEQAHIVLSSRIGHDEEIDPDDGGPFDYTIDSLNDMREVA